MPIPGPAFVDLELDSAPESVSVVRAGLKGLGALLEFDPELLDDLQMATSEACNNVVLHAYPGDRGPLGVRVSAVRTGVEVLVRDRGCGIEPALRETSDGDSGQAGLGLAVIQSLADRAELASPSSGGTELRMHFTRTIPALAPGSDPDLIPAARSEDLAGDVVATIAPVALLPDVLGRVARALAAQARFSVERFTDIHLIVDSLGGHVERFASDGHVTFALGSETRRLDLRIGPLRRRAVQITDRGTPRSLGLLPKLVDRIGVESRSDGDVLCLTLSERGLAHAV